MRRVYHIPARLVVRDYDYVMRLVIRDYVMRLVIRDYARTLKRLTSFVTSIIRYESICH